MLVVQLDMINVDRRKGNSDIVYFSHEHSVLDEQFEPLRYNTKAELLNPNFFVIGDTPEIWKELLS